jgi:hypothetical protein
MKAPTPMPLHVFRYQRSPVIGGQRDGQLTVK